MLRAKKALRAIKPGGALEVLATDPLSPVDFAAYCEASGDALVESVETDGASASSSAEAASDVARRPWPRRFASAPGRSGAARDAAQAAPK